MRLVTRSVKGMKTWAVYSPEEPYPAAQEQVQVLVKASPDPERQEHEKTDKTQTKTEPGGWMESQAYGDEQRSTKQLEVRAQEREGQRAETCPMLPIRYGGQRSGSRSTTHTGSRERLDRIEIIHPAVPVVAQRVKDPTLSL